jgi:hypothetical protein
MTVPFENVALIERLDHAADRIDAARNGREFRHFELQPIQAALRDAAAVLRDRPIRVQVVPPPSPGRRVKVSSVRMEQRDEADGLALDEPKSDVAALSVIDESLTDEDIEVARVLRDEREPRGPSRPRRARTYSERPCPRCGTSFQPTGPRGFCGSSSCLPAT